MGQSCAKKHQRNTGFFTDRGSDGRLTTKEEERSNRVGLLIGTHADRRWRARSAISLASEVEGGRERGEGGSEKQRPLILLSFSSLITPPAGAKRSKKGSPIRVIYSRSFLTVQ